MERTSPRSDNRQVFANERSAADSEERCELHTIHRDIVSLGRTLSFMLAAMFVFICFVQLAMSPEMYGVAVGFCVLAFASIAVTHIAALCLIYNEEKDRVKRTQKTR